MHYRTHTRILPTVIRRLLFVVGLFTFVGCLILLLNITAPNPTHRRYSSRVVLTSSRSTSSQAIGLDAENVLSVDVGLPSNNNADQRVCFCKGVNLQPNNCLSCAAYYAALTASFRIPDFISSGAIIESKNRQTLNQDDRDLLNQIGDYSLVAIALHRPLWIYVRVDSDVDPIYEQLAASTHGGLIRYFNVPGYVDPIDQVARFGLMASGGLILLIGVFEYTGHLRHNKSVTRRPSYVIPVRPSPTDDYGNSDGSAPRPAADTRSPHPKHLASSALSKTIEALNNAEKAAQQIRDKLD